MTDSQLKYQTLMEDRRHNLAVEKYSNVQAEAAKKSAEANATNARTRIYELAVNAANRKRELDLMATHYSNETTLNARKIGVAIAGQLTGGIGNLAGMLFA